MTIEDQIGNKVQELVKVEDQIQQFATMAQSMTTPGLLESAHDHLHELRLNRIKVRKELYSLKEQFKKELWDRLVQVNKVLDVARNNPWKYEELRTLSKDIENKIVQLDKELETLQP